MSVANEKSLSGISRPKLPLPPPALAGLAFGAQVLLSKRRASSTGSRIAGLLIAGASISLDVAATLEFKRNNTTMDPITLDATSLVETGPYRWTRNPMYLGAIGLLVAHAVARRSWPALIPAAVFATLIDRFQIPAEEAAMRQLFGSEYERYLAGRPRWLGPVPRRRNA